MDRAHFLKLGLGASLGMMTGVARAAGTGHALELWSGRHGGSLSCKKGELRVVVKPSRAALGGALQELAGLADGVLRCRGRIVTGVHRRQPFRVLLRAA